MMIKQLLLIATLLTTAVLGAHGAEQKDEMKAEIKANLHRIEVKPAIGRFKQVGKPDVSVRTPESGTWPWHMGFFNAEYRDTKAVKGHEINVVVGWIEEAGLQETISQKLRDAKNIRLEESGKNYIIRFASDGDDTVLWTDMKNFVVQIQAERLPAVPTPIITHFLSQVSSSLKKDSLTKDGKLKGNSNKTNGE